MLVVMVVVLASCGGNNGQSSSDFPSYETQSATDSIEYTDRLAGTYDDKYSVRYTFEEGDKLKVQEKTEDKTEAPWENGGCGNREIRAFCIPAFREWYAQRSVL